LWPFNRFRRKTVKALAYLIPAAAIAAVAAPAVARPMHGSSFLTEAMKGDNSETMLGKIAMQRGATAQTRQFGSMLVTDHSKAKMQVAALARKMGVPVTNAVAPEAAAERTKLSHLSGRAFDNEFGRYMVDDHQKDIAKFEAESKQRPDGAVATLAANTLPTLRKHLQVAKQI
jgi:putative membrane protein